MHGCRPDRRNGYAPKGMPAGSAVRNRSETVTVATPRGEVEVLRQEVRGLRRGSSWRWFWLARTRGSAGWSEASTAREAIRRAILLPPRKLPSWLDGTAAEAGRKLTAVESDEGPGTGSSGSSEASAVDVVEAARRSARRRERRQDDHEPERSASARVRRSGSVQ